MADMWVIWIELDQSNVLAHRQVCHRNAFAEIRCLCYGLSTINAGFKREKEKRKEKRRAWAWAYSMAM